MKFKVLALLLLFPFFSQAHTQLDFFLSGQAMVTVSTQTPDGQVMDNDASHLYELMNVAPTQTFIGPGKAIVSDNRDFNLSCGTPPSRGPMCSIIFKESNRVKMDPVAHQLYYHMHGKEAEMMSKVWTIRAGKLNFVATDGLMKIHIEPDQFELEVSGN